MMDKRPSRLGKWYFYADTTLKKTRKPGYVFWHML